MARTILSIPWKEAENAKMVATVKKITPKYEYTTGDPATKKWIVLRLSNLGIPFALHNLGCGVVKITTDTCVCPKCHGTGRVA